MNDKNLILETRVQEPARAERLHGLPPVADANTRLLILGSFPGVRSLAERRYYAHPQNQFWRLLQANLAQPGDEDLLGEARRYSYEQRLAQMLRWGVGLWDVYASCQRQGSLDTAIREAECNDFHALARRLPDLQAVAFNGGESWKHHRQLAELGLPLVRLPSSSPANASWTFARKQAAWREVSEQAGLAVRDLLPPG
jgi:hypoxanthine-DNA glycosylase